MFKKTIRFETLDGEMVKEDFYFHLSKTELMALSGEADSMQTRIKRIIASEDIRAVLEEFKTLVRMSVGVKSDDGRRFIKDEKAQSRLLDSPAFDELLFELISNPDASVEFVNNLIPKSLQEDLAKRVKEMETNDEIGRNVMGNVDEDDPRPAWMKENREPTEQELSNASAEELQAAFRMRIGRKKQD